MCAIVGSFNTEKLQELVKLNLYRGSHSYSFSLYDTYLQRLTIIKRNIGEIDLDEINVPSRHYGIVHVQAPTTSARDLDSVHPARAEFISSFTVDKNTKHEEYKEALWHNGILKEDTIVKLQQRYGRISWDTLLLLTELSVNGWSALDNIDGTFSCFYYNNGGCYLFRNEISPMFIDNELNISSTKFSNSQATEPNKVLKLEFDYKTAAPIHTFKTVENPYYFGEQ